MLVSVPVWIWQGAFGAAMAALGWYLQRIIKGERPRERANQLAAVAGLVESLRRTGLTLEQAQQIVRELSGGKDQPTPETARAIMGSGLPLPTIEEPDDHSGEPLQFGTTVALGFRLDARLTVLDAQVAQQLADLRILLPDNVYAALEKVQSAWETYRVAEAALEDAAWEGGTGATSASLAAMIGVTEKRLEALQEHCKWAAALYGR